MNTANEYKKRESKPKISSNYALYQQWYIVQLQAHPAQPEPGAVPLERSLGLKDTPDGAQGPEDVLLQDGDFGWGTTLPSCWTRWRRSAAPASTGMAADSAAVACNSPAAAPGGSGCRSV